ncbi:universal stress protein [Nocardioides aestuarii]|uniref:Universal stress protein n=1 Tax=Nocardioides aestuarii TaxID=252231 RepID=A0ABW4TR37_9ACTN
MHVLVTTDGSRQSLRAAEELLSFADPTKVTDVTVLAVVRPLAAVAFADDLAEPDRRAAEGEAGGFRSAAESAVDHVARVFDGWGPAVHRDVRSGSPADEIIKAAEELGAGLVVVAAGGRGLSDRVLVGSTAQRVQHYAPCPVLVVRPAPRKRR